MTLGKKPYENIVGKGENAGNQHFLLFHNVFNSIQDKYPFIQFVSSSANTFILDQSRNFSFW